MIACFKFKKRSPAAAHQGDIFAEASGGLQFDCLTPPQLLIVNSTPSSCPKLTPKPVQQRVFRSHFSQRRLRQALPLSPTRCGLKHL
jgi:hypothetical protein